MAVFATSGVDAPVREIAEKAGVGIGTFYRHFPQRVRPRSRPSSAMKSMPAPTLHKAWLPSTSLARRWRDGCSDTPPSLPPNVGLPRPCIRETRPSTACPPTSRSDSNPHLENFSSPPRPPAKSAPMSLPRNSWVRSQACACMPTLRVPITLAAWFLCSSMGYVMVQVGNPKESRDNRLPKP